MNDERKRKTYSSESAVTTEEMETTATKTEVFDDVEDLGGFVPISISARGFSLTDDEIDVKVGVDEIAVDGATHSAVDAHEAVFLCALEHCTWFQLLVAGSCLICLYPTDVFAASEAPLLQTLLRRKRSAITEFINPISRDLIYSWRRYSSQQLAIKNLLDM